MSNVTGEMFLRWKKNPVTKQLMRSLHKEIEVINNALVADDFLMSDGIAKKAAQLSGFRAALENITELTLDQIQDLEEEE